MRKKFKKFSKTSGLHHMAASIQNQRRKLLRQLGKGSRQFRFNDDISFPIDIAARRAFQVFSNNDPEMRLEMERFIQLSKGKKCLLDIGSLFGIFSLVFTSTNENSWSYAIEPSVECYKILDLNHDLNPKKNISQSQMAFGSEQGKLNMHYEWVHLIANHDTDNNQEIGVTVTTLDLFVKEHNIQPDIIKIDVDGYEGPVIAGAHNYLSGNDPIIFLELHGEWINRYGYTPEGIANTLKSYDYHFFDLDLKPVTNVKEAFNQFANRLICTKNPSDIVG